MLDIKLLRKDPVEFQKRLQTKDPSIDLKELLELDERARHLRTELEQKQALLNQMSKQIGEIKRRGEDIQAHMGKMSFLSDEVKNLEKEVKPLDEKVEDLLSRLPNLPDPSLKVSHDPKDNVCIKSYLEKPAFAFTPKNHVELGEELKLFDFKRSAKISGSGWPVYTGNGARLEWALLNYMIDIHIENGFESLMVPHLVRPDIMYGSGQLPKFDKQIFKLDDADYPLYLIPTAEVAINGMHYDEILEEEDLPMLYYSYTPCFRREAGAAGSQERGLIRMHQFNKVEMFAFATPEQAEEIFQKMIASAEQILQGLGLHYRNMLLVTGDSSFAASKTVDVEVWLPGQNRYYEVSSISLCTDFQARRSKTRYRGKDGKTHLAYTLNGSGLATSRLLVSLLECNQQADGSIVIPQVLHPYFRGHPHLKKACVTC